MRLIWTPTAPGATPYTPFVRILMDDKGIILRPMRQWRVPHWEALPQVVDRTLTLGNFDETLMGKAWHCYGDSIQGEPVADTALSFPKERTNQTPYEERVASWLRLIGVKHETL